MTTPQLVWPARATLGEGALWDVRRQCLWFVDIKQRRLNRFDPASGTATGWDAPDQIGWAVPATNGRLIAGVRGGLYDFDPESGAFTFLTPVEHDIPGNRLNDATVDAAGRIWFGSMDDAEAAASGRLYCWDGQQVRHIAAPAMAITNGPAISNDGRTLYLVDTFAREILSAPLSPDGEVGAFTRFVRVTDTDGYPDGPMVDADDHIWIGLFGGGAARRYRPDGALDRVIHFPVSNVTKVALGGSDLMTLFATTARLHLDDAALAREPDAGGIFAIASDVRGSVLPLARA
jgi:xylono-1,5-lactonase